MKRNPFKIILLLILIIVLGILFYKNILHKPNEATTWNKGDETPGQPSQLSSGGVQKLQDSEGSLKAIILDNSDQLILNKDEGLALLTKSKEDFNIPANIALTFDKRATTDLYTTYQYNLNTNGIKIANSSAQVTTDKEGKLVKISFDLNKELGRLEDTILDRTEEELKQTIDTQFSDILDGQEYLIIKSEKLLDSEPIYNIKIILENGLGYSLDISVDTLKILSYYSTTQDAKFSGEYSGNGITETGENVNFTVAKSEKGLFSKERYNLFDSKRNIHTVDNSGWWKLTKNILDKGMENANPFEGIAGLIDLAIEQNIRTEITSETTTFTDNVAVQSHKYIADAYDYYLNTFGLKSFDNNGCDVTVRVHSNFQYDNACYESNTDTFVVNPSKKFKYSVSSDAKVLGHEYTHAVFNHLGKEITQGSYEIRALNEAYADVMGILIQEAATGSTNWRIGEIPLVNGSEAVIRDIKNFNTAETLILNENRCPTQYKGEDWDRLKQDPHLISVVISHIAYEMRENGEFSNEDTAKIWFNSLGLGYDSSSDFLTCRKYMLKTAEDLGYSNKQINFIAKAFDDRGILDPDFQPKEEGGIEGQEHKEGLLENIFKKEDIHSENTDKVETRKIAFVGSYLGSIAKGHELHIYEVNRGLSKEEEDEITAKLTKNFNITNLNDEPIIVRYEQISKIHMKLLEKVFGQVDAQYNSLAEAFSENFSSEQEGTFRKILRLAFDCRVVELSAEEFNNLFSIQKGE